MKQVLSREGKSDGVIHDESGESTEEDDVTPASASKRVHYLWPRDISKPEILSLGQRL